MGFFDQLLNIAPCATENKAEVEKLIIELLRIGKEEDFLSTTAGAPFNSQCRHTRAREIGKQLDAFGGYALLVWVHERTRRKLGKNSADHLEYAWDGVGSWVH